MAHSVVRHIGGPADPDQRPGGRAPAYQGGEPLRQAVGQTGAAQVLNGAGRAGLDGTNDGRQRDLRRITAQAMAAVNATSALQSPAVRSRATPARCRTATPAGDLWLRAEARPTVCSWCRAHSLLCIHGHRPAPPRQRPPHHAPIAQTRSHPDRVHPVRYSLEMALRACSSRFHTLINRHSKGNAVLASARLDERSGPRSAALPTHIAPSPCTASHSHAVISSARLPALLQCPGWQVAARLCR